ncbi:hypothetical protein BPOR_0207g00130 [Botrytis porri]|uniref:ATP phosphoribosyltransferase n=2 Tax=Botrytis porri TaxID=87229 RepID=A0A4Z1KP12_9HELO|nr:hypothetical protein BPOR_0207g00130 [Botrytis porri]
MSYSLWAVECTPMENTSKSVLKFRDLDIAEKGAVPHTGKVRVLERAEEALVYILCTGEEVTRKAVEALKRTHPYEEVSYEV